MMMMKEGYQVTNAEGTYEDFKGVTEGSSVHHGRCQLVANKLVPAMKALLLLWGSLGCMPRVNCMGEGGSHICRRGPVVTHLLVLYLT